MPVRLRPADPDEVASALAREPWDRVDARLLVKHFLGVLSERAPGASVEVRVPPHAAAQVVPGVRHTRGTPPAVVELTAEVWLSLALGRTTWADEVAAGRVSASGERADLAPYLPLA